MKNKIWIIIIFFLFSSSVNALEFCSMSDEYAKWLSLSDSEKKKVAEPLYCEQKISKKTSKGLKLAATDERYSSVELGILPSVKDQGRTNSCWAYATNALLETSLIKKGIRKDLSEAHLEYMVTYAPFTDGINPFLYNRSLNQGGNYHLSSSYLFTHMGGIEEYKIDTTNIINNSGFIKTSKNNFTNKNVTIDIDSYKHAASTTSTSCSSSMINSIKEDLINYGILGSQISYEAEYLTNNYYFMNNTGDDPNHAINIVGWDDTISKDKFYNATRNGAWIVRNSWGSNWGNGGYFYISYDDVNICNDYYAMEASINKYDYSYSTVETSPIANLGVNAKAYIVAEFDKKTVEDEYIDKVGFGVEVNSVYDIYVVPDKTQINTMSKWKKVSTYTSNFSGIASVKFDPIKLDTDFAIVLAANAGSKIPVTCKATSSASQYYYTRVDHTTYFGSVDNWSNFSTLGGLKDGNVTTHSSCVPNIYAYTYKEANITSNTYNVSNKEIYIELERNKSKLSYDDLTNSLTFKDTYQIFDKNGNETNEHIGTKSKIKINNEYYTIIVKGDINGDGEIDLADLSKIYNYYLGKTTIKDYYYYAADLNKDSSVDLADLAKMYNFYLGKINKI